MYLTLQCTLESMCSNPSTEKHYSAFFKVFRSVCIQILGSYHKIGHDHSFRHTYINVVFEVLTSAIMKNYIFLNIMACSPLKVN
jgi:hypothetical protein